VITFYCPDDEIDKRDLITERPCPLTTIEVIMVRGELLGFLRMEEKRSPVVKHRQSVFERSARREGLSMLFVFCRHLGLV